MPSPETRALGYSTQFNKDLDAWSGELRLNGSVEVLGRPANLTFGVDHTKFEFVNIYGYSFLFNPDDPDDRVNIHEGISLTFPPSQRTLTPITWTCRKTPACTGSSNSARSSA